MAATVGDVRALDMAGQFATLNDSQIQMQLDAAAAFINFEAWGDKGDLAHALLAAHFCAESLAGAFAPSGAVASEAAGGLSRSYAVASTSTSSSFGATAYGRRFLELQKRIPFSPIVLGTYDATDL